MKYKYILCGLLLFVLTVALLFVLKPQIDGVINSDPTACNPHSSPPQKCPDGSSCPDTGICSEDAPTCQGTLEELCNGEEGLGKGGLCFNCAGKNQEGLKQAGCEQDEINMYCNPQPFDTEDSIQIKNSTGETMYVFFVNNAYDENGPKNSGWRSSTKATPTKANETFYYTVEAGRTLGFNKTDPNKGWVSVAACVTNTPPENPDTFSYDGLTMLEWTEDNNVISLDMSNTTGVNLQATLSVKGTNSDTNKLCNPKFTTQNDKKYGYTNNGIYRYGLKQNDPGVPGVPLTPPQCINKPDTIPKTDNTNCRDCPTGKDHCEGIGWSGDFGCVSENLRDRWGCYQWWGNPDNAQAQGWYEMLSDCDFYRWPYDEFTLMGSSDKTTFTMAYPIDCAGQLNTRCDEFAESNIYKCMTGGDYPCNENETRLVENKRGPLQSIEYSESMRIVFDIITILKKL